MIKAMLLSIVLSLTSVRGLNITFQQLGGVNNCTNCPFYYKNIVASKMVSVNKEVVYKDGTGVKEKVNNVVLSVKETNKVFSAIDPLCIYCLNRTYCQIIDLIESDLVKVNLGNEVIYLFRKNKEEVDIFEDSKKKYKMAHCVMKSKNGEIKLGRLVMGECKIVQDSRVQGLGNLKITVLDSKAKINFEECSESTGFFIFPLTDRVPLEYLNLPGKKDKTTLQEKEKAEIKDLLKEVYLNREVVLEEVEAEEDKVTLDNNSSPIETKTQITLRFLTNVRTIGLILLFVVLYMLRYTSYSKFSKLFAKVRSPDQDDKCCVEIEHII